MALTELTTSNALSAVATAAGFAFTPAAYTPQTYQQACLTAYEAVKGKVHASPEKHYNYELPETYSTHDVRGGNRTFSGRLRKPIAPKELIVNITGCNSQTIHWMRTIERLVSDDRAVFTANTIVPFDGSNFVADNYAMFDSLFLSEKSPVLQLAQELRVPIKIMAHSFGGNVVVNGLQDYGRANELRDVGISQIVLLNPYLGSKSLNEDRPMTALQRAAYLGWHAEVHGHLMEGEHPLDVGHAIWQKIKGERDFWASNGPPNHRTIKKLEIDAARPLKARMKAQGFSDDARAIPTIVIAGRKDYMADSLNSIRLADALGCPKKLLNAWHSIPEEDREAFIPIIMNALDGKLEEQVPKIKAENGHRWGLPFSKPQAAASSPFVLSA